MAIIPLPQATIHLLGSAQALTTPLSLVKELVDNAIDAKATSVDIIISQNTLEKIEVRDNGHGIPQEDLDALGRRGHTSKLRSFDELKSIGGVSLGFRGEALASAVQLGEVSVTTKADGEPVATCVKLKAPGGIASQTRTSHPVGTTVCVKNFISNIPVRMQTALKAAPKTLTKIKELLQAYALARPTIRFSLKVAKESKGSWSFSPRPNDGIREAVSQVIGRDAATECMEKTLKFPERDSTTTQPPISEPTPGNGAHNSKYREGQFVVDAFLPKPDANPSKIGHGQFLSIDSRPVSHEKGTMRKIVTLFKYYVKESLTETSDKIKSPFLRLNVRCPVASYDPNVEPAKDDVLFGNENLVIELIESLFKEIYGGPKLTTPQPSLSKKMNNFEMLLVRKPVEQQLLVSQPEARTIEIECPSLPGTFTSGPTSERPDEFSLTREEEDMALGIVDNGFGAKSKIPSSKWDVDMSKDLSEEVEGSQLPNRNNKFRPPGPACNQNPQVTSSRPNGLNPWVIAKMNAPVRRSNTSVTARDDREINQLPISIFPPTPRRSSDSSLPEVDFQMWPNTNVRRRRMSDPDDPRSVICPTVKRHSQTYYESPPGGNLGTRSHKRSCPVENDDDLLFGVDASQCTRKNDFISARTIPEADLISPSIIQRRSAPRRTSALNRALILPFKTVENPVSQDNLRQTRPQSAYQIPQLQLEIRPDNLQQQETHPDLAWAMDFEQRKEEATRQHRQKIRVARLEVGAELADAVRDAYVVRSSPHKNRYNAAVTNLDEGQGFMAINNVFKEPFKTTLPDGDPRAYLMRRRRSMSTQLTKPGERPRPMRAKSTRLPLERIPETEQLHTLVLTISTKIDSIRRAAAELKKDDAYVRSGNQARGFLMAVADTPDVIRRIQAVAVKWTGTENRKNYEFDYDFRDLLKASQ